VTDVNGIRCLPSGALGLRPGLLLAVLLGFGLGACGSSEPNTAPTTTDRATTTIAATTTATTSVTTTVATTAVPPSEVPATTTMTTNTSTAAPSPLPGQELLVPVQPSPTIDGTLEPGEWDGASVGEMSDGTGLFVMHDGESLYVAIDGEHLGAINIAIGGPKDTWILHSSAALGSVRYDSGGELSHDFDWCCRDADDPSSRLALLDAEGWQANIGYTGEPGIVEYQVALPWVGAAIAASAQTEVSEPAFFPPGLPPEARAQLVGPWPSTRTFQRGDWYTLLPAEE